MKAVKSPSRPVAELMRVTGATRANVRTWMAFKECPPALGRPPFFTVAEETVISERAIDWCLCGGLLTRERLSSIMSEYISGLSPARLGAAKARFGEDCVPKRGWFDCFLRRHPELCLVKPQALENYRAVASSPEAVAKFFAAYESMRRKYNVTSARQVWNSDESMIKAADLLEQCAVKVLGPAGTKRADYVIPTVQKGAEAASVVPTVCADGTQLPIFVVVAGSGGRLPYVDITRPDGTTNRVPLASYLGEDAEVHRRDKPGFNTDLWGTYAAFVARQLGAREPSKWKILLMDGCKVHANVDGLRRLRAAKICVLFFPSHLTHILQCLDKVPFLKVKAKGRERTRSILPDLPKGASFNLVNLMDVISYACLHGLSTANIRDGFRVTGTWPPDISKIDIPRLLLGKGGGSAKRDVDLPRLSRLLGPEARRELANPVMAFGSVSNRGRAVEANSDAVLRLLSERAALRAEEQRKKDEKQAAKDKKAEDQERAAIREETAAELRSSSPAALKRRQRHNERVQRQRAKTGSSADKPYAPVPGSVVVTPPKKRRVQGAR